jgi:hypothetical protein
MKVIPYKSNKQIWKAKVGSASKIHSGRCAFKLLGRIPI